MKNKANKTDKTLEWVIGSVIVIALILCMYFFREEVNRWYEDWDRVYCNMAESDALNIAATISDYFADPEHTILPTISGDSEYLGFTLNSRDGQNIAWVTGDYDSTITIVVQDGSGKCPEFYQELSPDWNSGKYTKILD